MGNEGDVSSAECKNFICMVARRRCKQQPILRLWLCAQTLARLRWPARQEVARVWRRVIYHHIHADISLVARAAAWLERVRPTWYLALRKQLLCMRERAIKPV